MIDSGSRAGQLTGAVGRPEMKDSTGYIRLRMIHDGSSSGRIVESVRSSFTGCAGRSFIAGDYSPRRATPS